MGWIHRTVAHKTTFRHKWPIKEGHRLRKWCSFFKDVLKVSLAASKELWLAAYQESFLIPFVDFETKQSLWDLQAFYHQHLRYHDSLLLWAFLSKVSKNDTSEFIQLLDAKGSYLCCLKHLMLWSRPIDNI